MKQTSTILFLLATVALTVCVALGLKQTVESMLASSDSIVVNELVKKSHKALVFGDANELEVFKSSLKSNNIGYRLKNARGQEIGSHHSTVNSSTLRYTRTISTAPNNVASLLIPSAPVAGNDQHTQPAAIGQLEVFFTHNSVLLNYAYIIAFVIAILIVLSINALILSVRVKQLQQHLAEKKDELDLITHKFMFYSDTLKSIFTTLSTDFKVANDVLSYSSNATSSPNDTVVAYAKNKMNRSLHSLLSIKDKVFDFNPVSAASENVYFAGSLDKTEALKLCFQVNNITLKHVDEIRLHHDNDGLTVLVDLDPIANDYDKIIRTVSLIPADAYVIGIFPHESSDGLPDDISSRLNWTLIEPVDIDDYAKTIKNKPSVRKLIDSAI